MKRRDQLVPAPLGAGFVFWAGMAFLFYTVYHKFPWVVAELRRLF